MTIKELIEHLESFENKDSEVKIWLNARSQSNIALNVIEKSYFVSDNGDRTYILYVG